MMWNAMGADTKQVGQVLNSTLSLYTHVVYTIFHQYFHSLSLPSPLQQYYDRSGKQKEEYQAFLESRKSETPPSGAGNAADTQSQSDQVQNATEEASATKQTVQIEATATQQGLTDVLTSDQMQKPPTPLQPKLVVG